MNDTKELFSVLNALLSNDNQERLEAEKLYSELEKINPDKMVDCLLNIINLNKNSYGSLLGLIKLSHFIEESANLENLISSSCLKRLQKNLLSLLSDYSCPAITRKYILSIIEDYIYITSGNESDWPELVPFFLSLLNDKKCTNDEESTNATNDQKSDTSLESHNNNNSFLRSTAITFFTYYLIVRPTDDFDSLVQPHLNLNAPDECERSASLKFALISLYNKVVSNSNLHNEGNKLKSFILQFPRILTSLSHEYFISNYSIFWKILKKNEKLFSDILSEIAGLLITNVSNNSNAELFRRDSLYFFHRLYVFSNKCKKLINSDLVETVIKIISSVLQNPSMMPDLYEEAKETIFDILNESCEKEYEGKNENKSGIREKNHYINNALEIAQKYAEGSNIFVSSFYHSFFRGDMFIEKIFENSLSPNNFIRENGLFCIKKRIEQKATQKIGAFLFNSIESKILSQLNYFGTEDLDNFIELFCFWCQKSDKNIVEPFLKKVFDIIYKNDSYHLLYCASVICVKCHESSKFILKKLMAKLFKNSDIDKPVIDLDFNDDFIDPFKLSIVSNSFQCIDQISSQNYFKQILPLCLKSSSSVYLINSTPFLEIMEIIGYNFVSFLDQIIPHLFAISVQKIENILPVIDCFEKIVSLFSPSKSINAYLESILNFAITYGSKEMENENGEEEEIDANKVKALSQLSDVEINQIRLESIILLDLILQNNWDDQNIYGKCLQFIMIEIPNEYSENCLDALFSILILFIEHEDEEKCRSKASNEEDETVPILGMKKMEILKYFLDYIPFAISRAIENNSEGLFASAASIFVLLLKRIPNEATDLLFQVQKVIPHYSVYSPPVTPPSDFTSPFSNSAANDTTINYNNSNQIRCFSLMLWTDFVTFGPTEHALQYQKSVIDDLKFYSEKENPLKNKNEEHFRKIAIICLYSYYISFTSSNLQSKKSLLEIETVLDEFYRIASNVNSNSIEIIESATAAFAIVFIKYANEQIFVLRTRQLIQLIGFIQRQSEESDTVFNTVFQLAIMCLKNTDIFDFFAPLVDILQRAIEKHLISDTTIDDISQGIIELGEKAPHKLRSLIQL